jgi:hypothetical protein
MEPWEHILNCKGYAAQDAFTVTADDMKTAGKSWKGKASQFEPRLLAYQTCDNDRPAIFKKHGLYILPIKNGEYLLTKKSIYTPLSYDGPSPTSVKRDTSSSILTIGGSETSLIDNIRYSGILERPEILGEPITHGPLLNGRHRISMSFTLGETPISISGVQYETDSCYESANKILLIEGKSSPKPIDSFNTRQLYFPYREVLRASKGKKEIICVFIHELRGIIHVWKYTFTDPEKMDSILLTGHYTFALVTSTS